MKNIIFILIVLLNSSIASKLRKDSHTFIQTSQQADESLEKLDINPEETNLNSDLNIVGNMTPVINESDPKYSRYYYTQKIPIVTGPLFTNEPPKEITPLEILKMIDEEREMISQKKQEKEKKKQEQKQAEKENSQNQEGQKNKQNEQNQQEPKTTEEEDDFINETEEERLKKINSISTANYGVTPETKDDYILENLSTPVYQCNDNESANINEQQECLIIKDNDYSVLKCPDGFSCENTGSKDKPKYTCVELLMVEDSVLNKLTPGKTCLRDTQCLNGKCENGVCKGKGQDEECENHSDCLLNLYCDENSKTCQSLKEAGSKCLTDFECDITSGCLDYRCTKYFSLETGSHTNDHALCKSNFTVSNEEGEIFCADLILNDIYTCKKDQEYCNYTIDNHAESDFIQLACRTSIMFGDRKFCGALPSTHVNHTKSIEDLVMYYEKNKKKIHTVERLDARFIGDFNVKKQVLYDSEFPNYVGASDCIFSQFIQKEINNGAMGLKSSLIMALLTVLILI